MNLPKFYLDTRTAKADGTYPLKLIVTHKRQSIMLSLDVSLKERQWVENTIVRHSNSKMMNIIIGNERTRVTNLLYDLEREGKLPNLSPQQLRSILKGESTVEERNLFANYYKSFCQTRRKQSTASIYLVALNKVKEYINDDIKFNRLRFEDINKEWLNKFQSWMLGTCCLNTCNIHFRSIRAVFNDAIDNDVTTNYPFRKFKLKTVRTAKRSLSVEELREYFNYPVEPEQQKWMDMFKLTFMLIGINSIDLYNLDRIIKGRIEYNRSKTYRHYSIKVEPEAMELINKYSGEKKLLYIADKYKDHLNFVRRLNRELKSIGPTKIVSKHGKKEYEPLHPEISTYWARHSWATIAASLDIPKETIAAALGHGGNTVTDIYIDFDQRKVDEANRRVLDWVLYGKQ